MKTYQDAVLRAVLTAPESRSNGRRNESGMRLPAGTREELSAGNVAVRVLRSAADLEEIRPFWESWPGTRESDLDSYLTFLGESRESIRPHVIAVFRDGAPESIFVGRLDDTHLTRVKVGYFRIRPRIRALYFVYGALRGNPGADNCSLILQEIRKCLSEGEADLAYLNFLPEDSELYSLTGKIPGILSRDRLRTTQKHYTATLPRTVEEFRQNLSPRLPRNRQWARMNKQLGKEVKIERFSAASEIERMSAVVEQVAAKSYQRGIGVGFFNNEQERRRLELLASKDGLRGYVIYIDETPAAFWIGDKNNSVFGSDCLGFDPAFGKYSPGMYLMMKVMEGFCAGEDDVTEIDFATGHADYKEALSNRVWRETDVYLFSTSLKGVWLNLLKTSAIGADQTLKWMLERTGLLKQIKKRWRRRLAKKS